MFLDAKPFIFPTNSDISFVFVWEGLGDPQETDTRVHVLTVVYSVCVATSLGHLIALKERGSRRKNMGMGFPVDSVVKNSPAIAGDQEMWV